MGFLARLFPNKVEGANERRVHEVYGSIVLTTAGAVSSYSGVGVTVTKVGGETGRYLVTISRAYQRLLYVAASLQQATATAGAVKPIDSPTTGSNTAGATLLLETEAGTPGTPANLAAGTIRFKAVFSEVDI